ncbi:hypothetical protein MKW98_005123 [Papaver atlanticum]|uniref:Uncharacterized protein n=1 Tax=Papaver atlanticum TaxID=357466 RepID=A0AAD4RX88_9MAGN|nr:hypothetical protein MKW98_005123 [Papaver atlanticum]
MEMVASVSESVMEIERPQLDKQESSKSEKPALLESAGSVAAKDLRWYQGEIHGCDRESAKRIKLGSRVNPRKRIEPFYMLDSRPFFKGLEKKVEKVNAEIFTWTSIQELKIWITDQMESA